MEGTTRKKGTIEGSEQGEDRPLMIAGEQGESIAPLAFLQWLSRKEICELLSLTPRTIQKRVEKGDIERREESGRPLYCLQDTSWSRDRLKLQTNEETVPDIISTKLLDLLETERAKRLELVVDYEKLCAVADDQKGEIQALREQNQQLQAELETLHSTDQQKRTRPVLVTFLNRIKTFADWLISRLEG
jgi:hypothetical protein